MENLNIEKLKKCYDNGDICFFSELEKEVKESNIEDMKKGRTLKLLDIAYKLNAIYVEGENESYASKYHNGIAETYFEVKNDIAKLLGIEKVFDDLNSKDCISKELVNEIINLENGVTSKLKKYHLTPYLVKELHELAILKQRESICMELVPILAKYNYKIVMQGVGFAIVEE